jgi:hypothetical protein
MPRGTKFKYTGKQKQPAKYVEEGYIELEVAGKKPERIEWKTVKRGIGRTGKMLKANGSSRKSGRKAIKKTAAARKRRVLH